MLFYHKETKLQLKFSIDVQSVTEAKQCPTLLLHKLYDTILFLFTLNCKPCFYSHSDGCTPITGK